MPKQTAAGRFPHESPRARLFSGESCVTDHRCVDNICANPDDGTYLPIVVKMAVLYGDETSSSIGAIYHRAVTRLLRAKNLDADARMTEAKDLCERSYWKNGRRLLPYRNADERNDKPVLKMLRAANIVVDVADSSVRRGDLEPLAVRFFHDSVQSYVTAMAVTRPNDYDVLLRAAGDPMFFEQSGSVTRPVFRSELFAMCLDLCPLASARAHIQTTLREWAAVHDQSLRKEDVLNAALHDAVRNKLARLDNDALSAGALLKVLVSECGDALPALAFAFGQLAPTVYAVVKRKPELIASIATGPGP